MVEPVRVQTLVAEPPIETLDLAILHRPAWLDEHQLDPPLFAPAQQVPPNGAKSRGPLTPQTRAKASLNARKHGLCAKTLLLPGESEERLQELYDDLFDEFQPQTTSEYLQFETLAAAWRQLRARAHETGYLADELARGASSTREAWSRSADARLMNRYETSHRRAFDGARRDLPGAWFTRVAFPSPAPADPGSLSPSLF